MNPPSWTATGPIPPSMARRLVADGADSFHRVLTDPRDGAPLEIGRTSYRIPTAMRQWLRLRDGKCPFPGCNNHSLDNEADHLLAWADGGTTGITNLGQPCRKHHRLKHTTAWTPTRATKNKPPGWTSPTGRHYQSEHQNWEPPHWPPQAAPARNPGTIPDTDDKAQIVSRIVANRNAPGAIPARSRTGTARGPVPGLASFTAAHRLPAADTETRTIPCPAGRRPDHPYRRTYCSLASDRPVWVWSLRRTPLHRGCATERRLCWRSRVPSRP